jgi:thioester reductase-like protein
MVTSSGTQGLPIYIYRPGMVTGHSQTGISNPEDVMCRFLTSLIELQIAPNLDLMLDMTPVDYVSQAIVHLSRQPELVGKAFHLLNPHPIPLDKIVDLLISFGHSIELVSYEEWQTTVSDRQNSLSTLAPVIIPSIGEHQLTRLEMWLAGSQMFDCQNAIALLNGSGINPSC